MSGNDRSADPGGENVLITPGEITTISGSAGSADAGESIATGGDAVALSLSPDREMLNVAFLTGGGSAQIIQVAVADLTQACAPRDGAVTAQRDDETSSGSVGTQPPSDHADRLTVIAGHLTTVSGAAIAAGGGAATTVDISVAAELNAEGQLSLTFVDGEGDLQLVETRMADHLRSGGVVGSGDAA